MVDNTTLRESILNNNSLKSESMHVDEWGVDIVIKEMTARQRAEFEDMIQGDQDDKGVYFRGLLVVSTVHDAAGNQVFTADDIDQLMEQSGGVIGRIAQKALTLCGMSGDAIEEAEKN